LLIVLAIVMLLFGRQLPKLARSMGQASREFRKGIESSGAGDGSEPPDAS
jgi:TatA/E family protein of Tat protein translocase